MTFLLKTKLSNISGQTYPLLIFNETLHFFDRINENNYKITLYLFRLPENKSILLQLFSQIIIKRIHRKYSTIDSTVFI